MRVALVCAVQINLFSKRFVEEKYLISTMGRKGRHSGRKDAIVFSCDEIRCCRVGQCSYPLVQFVQLSRLCWPEAGRNDPGHCW